MKKEDLIKELSEKLSITQVEARNLLDSTFDELGNVMADGKSVNFQGFGTFGVKELEERKGFNPMLQKWMMLPRKIKSHFKPSDILKEKVNKHD